MKKFMVVVVALAFSALAQAETPAAKTATDKAAPAAKVAKAATADKTKEEAAAKEACLKETPTLKDKELEACVTKKMTPAPEHK